jgi:hypothetical protein
VIGTGGNGLLIRPRTCARALSRSLRLTILLLRLRYLYSWGGVELAGFGAFSSSSLSSESAPSRSAVLGFRACALEAPLGLLPGPEFNPFGAKEAGGNVDAVGKGASPPGGMVEAELEPDALLEIPEITDTEDDEPCRASVGA